MKKNISLLSILSVVLFFEAGLFALDITSETEVSPHLQLVKFENNIEYVIGQDVENITSTRKPADFAINKLETTYGLWYDVRIKAEKNGYKFANPGRGGSHGKRGAEPVEKNIYQPVAMITWYDAIVWCNAYSELQGRKPCYTYNGQVLRDSTDTAACDLSICNWKADGFRLPSESEWEYAARFTDKGMASGNLISGQASSHESGLLYAWTYENADSTRIVGTAGIPFDKDIIVKKGTGNPNGAGLFDMSGNILEFCWDWYGDYNDNMPYGPDIGAERVSRGGSWSPYTMFVYSGDRYSFDPNICYPYMGFRIACTLTK